MYGPKKTNINHHKFFHVQSGPNREKIENAERQAEEKQEEAVARSKQLQKERQDEQYDKLRKDGLNGKYNSGLVKRTPINLVPASTSQQGMALGGSSTSGRSSHLKTGTISAEEAKEARKKLDDARKEAIVPLRRLRELQMPQQVKREVSDGAGKKAAPSSGLLDRLNRRK